jgi:hypothetical protein
LKTVLDEDNALAPASLSPRFTFWIYWLLTSLGYFLIPQFT